jgi:O-antigen ligase
MFRSLRSFHLAGLLSPVFLAGILLCLSPLIRGGNRSVALWVLETLGLVVLLVWCGRRLPSHSSRARAGATDWAFAETLLVWTPVLGALLYLTPVPAGLWMLASAREAYLPALDWLAHGPQTWLPLTLTPESTWISLLAAIPVVACFLVARTVRREGVSLLLDVLVGVAVVQALFGLLQSTRYQGLFLGAEFSGSAIGSFANSNHFANYLAMALPVALLQLWESLAIREKGRTRLKLTLPVLLRGLAVFFLLVGVLVSGSRMGFVCALVVSCLAGLLVVWQLKHHPRWRWVVAGGCAVLAVAVVAVGVRGVTGRLLSGSELLLDAGMRGQILASSWQLAWMFFPLGSGPGSFGEIYPMVQPASIPAFVEHAHNDYVQLLVEWGVAGLWLMGLVAWLVGGRLCRLWAALRSGGRLSPDVQVSFSALFGFLAILLHGMVDFNWHIPANAMMAAFLLGVFLRPAGDLADDSR